MINATLASQLLALGLDSLSVKDPEPGNQEMPSEEAMQHTVHAAWNELFGLIADTPLEQPGEDLAWQFVNLFHKAAEKQERKLDDATDQIRLLLAEDDHGEIASSNLEEKIARAQAAEAAMQAFETMREQAAMLYCAETTHSWRPYTGGRNARGVTSAIVDGRQFLKARADTKRQQALPPGHSGGVQRRTHHHRRGGRQDVRRQPVPHPRPGPRAGR